MKRNSFQGYILIAFVGAIVIIGVVYHWRFSQPKVNIVKINRQIQDKRARIASLRIEVKRLRAKKQTENKRRKEVDETVNKILQEYEQLKSGKPITETTQQLEPTVTEKPQQAEIQENVLVYFNQAEAKEKRGQVREAIADYDQIIELQPDNVKAYLYRGLAKVRAAEYQEAIMDFDKIIELEPDNSDGYYRRAEAKAELAKYVDAVIDYDTAIQLASDNPFAYYGRASVKMKLGLTSEAKQDMDKYQKLINKMRDDLK